MKSIKLDLQDGKYVELLQTSSVNDVIGEQGGFLSCSGNEQFIFIPSGALLSDTTVRATVYQVVDSVGLDGTEFVTSMLEVTPHELKFAKPIEILMCHHLFVDGDSSRVEVLYHSGASTDKSMMSLCELTSVNEACLANGMTMTLWEDFVHIETSHICTLGFKCKGQSFINIWASLHTLKSPKPNQVCVRLFLTKSRPEPNDEIFKDVETTGCELECRYCAQLQLSCKAKKDIKVTVEIPSSTKGWRPRTDSDMSHTIEYEDVQNLVVQGRPYIRTDFAFEKTLEVDATDFDPIFKFNNTRCVLSPSTSRPSDAVSTGSEDNNVRGNFFT